jgi:hypothetical protein
MRPSTFHSARNARRLQLSRCGGARGERRSDWIPVTSSGSHPSGTRWYADWRVWFCFAVLALGWLVGLVVGLPFRLFDRIWSLFF